MLNRVTLLAILLTLSLSNTKILATQPEGVREPLQEQIDFLRYKVQVLEHTVERLESNRFTESVISNDPNNTFSSDMVPEVQGNKVDADKKMYEEAFTLLQQGEEKKAAEKFDEFIKKFPNNKQTSSAYYWIGEIYRRDQNYDAACKNFLEGYRANPKDSKAPLHLIKLSSCLQALGREKVACKVVNKALFQYKNMPLNVKKEALQIKNSLLECQ